MGPGVVCGDGTGCGECGCVIKHGGGTRGMCGKGAVNVRWGCGDRVPSSSNSVMRSMDARSFISRSSTEKKRLRGGWWVTERTSTSGRGRWRVLPRYRAPWISLQ